jgi:hypothetical protein
MRLQDHVQIARRFQRSIRIDTDLADAQSLTGFICPASSANALVSMAKHISDTSQTAFTWTGPYGSGKSSLVVALCASLSGNADKSQAATEALGGAVVRTLVSALPPKKEGWRILPVVGHRARLAELIGEALERKRFAKRPAKGWTDKVVLEKLNSISAAEPETSGGLLLVIDEMGKVLEGAAHDGYDIYLLQQLAELSSRSNRRFVLLGILHQAFDEYAQRLTGQTRDEWAKVQGRFIDLVINSSGDEQLELIARALEVSTKPRPPKDAIVATARVIRPGNVASQRPIAALLTRCWPLHPVVASLLGPLSRRRFGQNQRSLFAFLNSAEPKGFHDFLTEADHSDLYMPSQLWDYLRINLEPSILASPDGHRWSIGADALERCVAAGGTPIEQDLLKTIALIDLFRERSGLQATVELLRHCVSAANQGEVSKALEALTQRSCIVFRRHLDAYALYAGSDFDIEDALTTALPSTATVDLAKLRQIAGVQPVLAKRHYHETGAIRWFSLDLVRLQDLPTSVVSDSKSQGAAGRFIIVVPTEGESSAKVRELCAELIASTPPTVVLGSSDDAWRVVQLAREFMALSIIHDERPELRGDPVARKEVLARLGEAKARLENELQDMIDNAQWFRAQQKPETFSISQLNTLASSICDEVYGKAPRILNELLNRDSPSSNAVKAQRELMKRMLTGAGVDRLGLQGWPAEAGLLESILVRTGLYRTNAERHWGFVAPAAEDDPANLNPAWYAGLNELKSRHATAVSVGELFDLWRRPPFGIKEGLLPILALAIYLVHRDRLAVYRQGQFQPELSELDVELITSDANHIQFRWIELTEAAKTVLMGLQDLALRLDPCSRAESGAPLDIARSLVTAFDQLPAWTKRTTTVSPVAQKLTVMLRYASDPNRLLFDDIPGFAEKSTKASANGTVAMVTTAFEELREAYPSMLRQLERLMFAELEVPKRDIEGLRDRANNLVQVANDLRLKAFIQRLAQYHDAAKDMEGIASLATQKKPADWSDADVIEAKRRLAELAQQFKQHEEIARVAGRPDGRHRMSVIVPREGFPRAIHSEFVVNAHDSADVTDLISKLDSALRLSPKSRQSVILAALAELSARYMEASPKTTQRRRAV